MNKPNGLQEHDNHVPTSDSPLQTLTSTLTASPQTFLLPPPHLSFAALDLAKRYLDPLASSVSAAQRARFVEAREEEKQRHRQRHRRRRRRHDSGDDYENDRKRKRGVGKYEYEYEYGYGSGDFRGGMKSLMKLQCVHVEGFATEQVWGQARKVLDAVCGEVERGIKLLEREVGSLERNGLDGVDGRASEENEDEEDKEDEEESEDEDEDEDEEDIDQISDEEASPNRKQDKPLKGASSDSGESYSDESGDIDMDEALWEDGDDDEYKTSGIAASKSYTADPHGLNDGFFSIDDFNRQSEYLERMDARGDPDNGAASDEEDVDWTMDPLAMDAGKSELEDDKNNTEEDNHNVHYDRRKLIDGNDKAGSDGSSIDEDDIDGVDIIGNANNILYKDFFEPPPKRKTKKKQDMSTPRDRVADKNIAEGKVPLDKDIGQDEIERAISTVQRDLFDDEVSVASDESDTSEKEAVATSNFSSHQKRQARLVEQIRQLEAENVAKREWTLSGEAKANERPLNSLLEEDLDFERIGKPAPVITAEVSEDLETLIKRRILDREFDELRRYQPGALLPNPDVRRGKLQVDDSKSKKGLAEEYEEEHLRRTDPNFVDVKDEKLRAKHREIEKLWQEVSGKLDALASWHYRPKPAEASLEIRVAAPAITMEDARPTAGSEIAGASRLAPQEIYKPGQQSVENDEVVTKGGSVIKRDEMTREQKKRRRRREKERMRKANGNPLTATTANGVRSTSKKAEERSKILTDLKKGGVKVIDKKGELKNLDDKKAGARVEISGGSLKL